MCQHIWTCRHVLIFVDMCQHVASLSVPLIPIIWTLSACWYVSAHGHADLCWYVPTCVGMCQHVTSLPTPMIPIILTLSACRHVSAHVWTCQHVISLPAPLKRIIWTLSACWLVLVHEDMQTSTDMWRRVLTCADICRHVQICSITLGTFGTNHLDPVGMLACISTCGHAPMCRHLPACANMWCHSRHLC